MFIGHFAVALAAKRSAPRTSLGTLFAACQLPDLLWPIFLLPGWERVEIRPGATAWGPLVFVHYPFSHSLATVVGWGTLFALGYLVVRRYPRGALVVGALVLSHWALDALVHVPDLPLWPGGGPLVGLGLWRSVPVTLIVELGMFAAGIWLYVSGTRPRDTAGRVAFWTLVAFLLAAYLGSTFGPPPPDVRTLAASALAIWLLIPWGAWADRHRRERPA